MKHLFQQKWYKPEIIKTPFSVAQLRNYRYLSDILCN